MGNKEYRVVYLLILSEVILTSIIGIFASKIEEVIKISTTTLAWGLLVTILSLSVIHFTLWMTEQNNAHITLPAVTIEISKFLAIIPISLAFGSLLALVLVHLFSKRVYIKIDDIFIVWMSLYEIVGILIILAAGFIVTLKNNGLKGLILMWSTHLSFSTFIALLDPSNPFNMTFLGWIIPLTFLLVFLRGIIALFGK